MKNTTWLSVVIILFVALWMARGVTTSVDGVNEVRVGLTTNGVATFWITKDQTPTGDPVYTNITSAIATSNLNVTNAIEVPICSVKLISADTRRIDVNVISGRMIPVTGSGSQPSVQFVPTNAIVFLLVTGRR